MLSIPKDSTVTARANTAFGERIEVEWSEDEGPITTKRAEKGLVITEILKIGPSGA
jgi:hypothetical protein